MSLFRAKTTDEAAIEAADIHTAERFDWRPEFTLAPRESDLQDFHAMREDLIFKRQPDPYRGVPRGGVDEPGETGALLY